MMKKILILAGGYSKEKEVSIQTAKSVYSELNKDRTTTLNDLINQQTRFGRDVVNLSKKFLTLELRNKELNKTFGINFKQAGVLGRSYDKLAKSFGVSGQATRK